MYELLLTQKLCITASSKTKWVISVQPGECLRKYKQYGVTVYLTKMVRKNKAWSAQGVFHWKRAHKSKLLSCHGIWVT